MIRYMAGVALAVHSIYAGVTLYDLAFRSKRGNKVSWAIFIIFVPAIGIILYNHSKQRKKHVKNL